MKPHSIMIVDDDESVRSLLRMTFPTEEYEITEARNGEEALKQLRTKAPDLVLLDWRMPGVGGSSVLDAVKADYPQLPVIVLTSEVQKSTRVLAEVLGVDAYLRKPFSPRELLETVERLLPERPVDESA